MVKASDTCATEAVFLHPGLNWNLVQWRRRKNMFKLPHTTLCIETAQPAESALAAPRYLIQCEAKAR